MSNSDFQFDFDPGDPNFYNDPYPAYEKMRRAGPWLYWRHYGQWCTGSNALVHQLLRDKRLGRIMPGTDLYVNAPAHLKPFYQLEKHSLLEMEPPRHTHIRKLVHRAFVSANVKAQAPSILAICHGLIDRIPDTEHFDLLETYATPIPVMVIAQMVGIDFSYCQQMLSWSHDMVAMYQHDVDEATEQKAVRAAVEFSEFIQSTITERRKAPAEDLLSHLIACHDEGSKLSEAELVTTIILLLNAGHEATVHAIGNGVKTVLEHHDSPDKLVSDPQMVVQVCEELLRFDPPLHKFDRYVYEPIEIEGRRFGPGDKIGLLLGAANRDPDVFTNPDRLEFDRPNLSRQATFGAGIHFCIGAPLARLEMQLALSTLFKRLPNLRLASKPSYADRYHFHGLENLRLTAQGSDRQSTPVLEQ